MTTQVSQHSWASSTSNEDFQESPTNLSGFTACLHLDKILSETVEELYSPIKPSMAWVKVQGLVSDLDTKLTRWSSNLPQSLKLSTAPSERPPRERFHLAFRFYSARMIINWPCLIMMRNINPFAITQPETLKPFDAEAAKHCRDAAKDLLRLLPDHGTASAIYDSTPWWCVLHFIVQAAVVLGTAIQIETSRAWTSEDDDSITGSIRALRWLMVLSDKDSSARRAWYALSRLLLLSFANVGRDTGFLSPFIPVDISVSQSFASSNSIFLDQSTTY